MELADIPIKVGYSDPVWEHLLPAFYKHFKEPVRVDLLHGAGNTPSFRIHDNSRLCLWNKGPYHDKLPPLHLYWVHPKIGERVMMLCPDYGLCIFAYDNGTDRKIHRGHRGGAVGERH